MKENIFCKGRLRNLPNIFQIAIFYCSTFFFVQSTNCWIVFFMKLDVKAPREKDQNKE
jgi:hypothetical protein